MEHPLLSFPALTDHKIIELWISYFFFGPSSFSLISDGFSPPSPVPSVDCMVLRPHLSVNQFYAHIKVVWLFVIFFLIQYEIIILNFPHQKWTSKAGLLKNLHGKRASIILFMIDALSLDKSIDLHSFVCSSFRLLYEVVMDSFHQVPIGQYLLSGNQLPFVPLFLR